MNVYPVKGFPLSFCVSMCTHTHACVNVGQCVSRKSCRSPCMAEFDLMTDRKCVYRRVLIKSAELLSIPKANPPPLSCIWLFFEALCVCVSLSLQLTKNKEQVDHDHDCQRPQIPAARLNGLKLQYEFKG